MAATESDILRDEQERSNLLGAISSLETAIAVSNPGARRVLENALDNSRKRVATLDAKIEVAKVEHAAAVQMQVAAAALAAKETKLNGKERETYRGFLEESYFTKRDLGRLDEFYTHGYDRLSEDGKEQMSERLHEGIRRGEIKVIDLSKAILDRDNAHCSAKARKELGAHAYSEKGDESSNPAKPAGKKTVEGIDLGSVDLTGVKLADVIGVPSVSSVPDVTGSRGPQR